MYGNNIKNSNKARSRKRNSKSVIVLGVRVNNNTMHVCIYVRDKICM